MSDVCVREREKQIPWRVAWSHVSKVLWNTGLWSKIRSGLRSIFDLNWTCDQNWVSIKAKSRSIEISYSHSDQAG